LVRNRVCASWSHFNRKLSTVQKTHTVPVIETLCFFEQNRVEVLFALTEVRMVGIFGINSDDDGRWVANQGVGWLIKEMGG
jgi:hypothetical protein